MRYENYPELIVNLRLKKWYQVSGIRYQVSGIRYQVSGISNQVSAISNQQSDFRSQTSDPMLQNKKTYILLAAFIAVVTMLWNVVNEPGIKDLAGNFKEVAFIRNEQNSGPVIRIYAVTVNGEYWKEMEQYGNYMPHTKYGTTRIYFFSDKKAYPTILTLGDDISANYRANCIGIYEKNGMSQVLLRKHPYRNGLNTYHTSYEE